jgi:DNA-binding NarL/FixJ family response regulator
MLRTTMEPAAPLWDWRGHPVKLGPRECDVLRVLLTGADNLEIARQLGMAPRTVKAHFNRLFLKFGISGGVKRVKLAVIIHRQTISNVKES